MTRSLLFWLLAFIITAGSAVFQRMTGPTYPQHGSIDLEGADIRYALERSHSTSSDCAITLTVADPSVTGVLEWKRNRSGDAWTPVPMTRSGSVLSGILPAQPPAGKLAYRLTLTRGSSTARFPEQPVVVRFKGDVPMFILIAHIGLMFTGMLFSTRCGLDALLRTPNAGTRVTWTLALLTLGGLVLGPVVQHYAFGAFWTGWPFGHDLTDNKTAVIVLAWLLAALRLRKPGSARIWILVAAIVTLTVYLIPHSLLGSELQYASPG